MEINKVFENIETITIDNPVDKIIKQLKDLISNGQIKPGDRLPAERILAENFGVGRSHIREAILKLEFYGLLKTNPQSGTYVAGFSIKIMDSIFADIIKFNTDDFASFIESRYYLEIDAARLAAERRTDDDIIQLKDALAEFDLRINQGNFAAEEDMLFHIKLAEAAKNPVLESMLIILIPHLIKIKDILDKDICHERSITLQQHHRILDAVIAKDAEAAAKAMQDHLAEMMSIRTTLKSL
jgi:GntR family transcriptional regulator, transcriptional repressor for pyruvate dehydrogenase complex